MKSIKCCWHSNIFKNFKKDLKKAKIIKKKNSIKICKVFVTSLNSELRQCFPPLWLRHSSFAAGAGEFRAEIKRCPPRNYLVINTPHFKGFRLFSCSFCWSVHSYHLNLRDVCHGKKVLLVQQSESSQAQLIISCCQARRNRMKLPLWTMIILKVYHPRSLRTGNCAKHYMPTTDRK